MQVDVYMCMIMHNIRRHRIARVHVRVHANWAHTYILLYALHMHAMAGSGGRLKVFRKRKSGPGLAHDPRPTTHDSFPGSLSLSSQPKPQARLI